MLFPERVIQTYKGAQHVRFVKQNTGKSKMNADALLRHTLRANALFSATCGLTMLLFAGPLTTLLGIPKPLYLLIIGGGLLIFAFDLFTNTRRTDLHLFRVKQAIVMDTAWVIGSLIVLALIDGVFTKTGWWVIVIIADTVAVFAILQAIGLRRIRQRSNA